MEQLGQYFNLTWKRVEEFYAAHPVLVWALGLAGSFILGHLTNVFSDWRSTKKLKAKQERFIDELYEALDQYLTSEPADEEVAQRRKDVKAVVIEKSKQIFGKSTPPIKSFRPGNTEYPILPCKWCHRDHQAWDGPEGQCKTCPLPLDLWMGSQGKTHKK
jgi:hypothetical protein